VLPNQKHTSSTTPGTFLGRGRGFREMVTAAGGGRLLPLCLSVPALPVAMSCDFSLLLLLMVGG